MCLHETPHADVPEETARCARAAFRRGSPYLRLRDAFGPLFADAQFRSLFPRRGRAAEAPWRLALVTLLQFAEGLSDRQAADAVRARLDWKYVLGLELSDPGFDFTLLSDFRQRLLAQGAERLLLETLLARFREVGLIPLRGTQRTDATHVEAQVRELNRLELVGETLRHALQVLAQVAPGWLREQADPAWVERYDRPCNEWRLPKRPEEREALARQIGEDGFRLLMAVVQAREAADAGAAWQWLGQVPAVETLRQVWVQQFFREEREEPPSTGRAEGEARPRWVCGWRTKEDLPPSQTALCSPYDPEARFAKKRETTWVGYKVHVTETCETAGPLLITDVETTTATAGDPEALAPIQARLAAQQLLPGRQVADSGYISGSEIVRSEEEYGVELLGPPQGDRGWQARAGAGFALADFAIDWEAQRVRCPGGRESAHWEERAGRSGPNVLVRFAAADCRECPCREACTRAKSGGRRLTLQREAQHAAVTQLREQVRTGALAVAYAVRAGIEGTISQAVGSCGLRRSRYRGMQKVTLQHIFTAAGLNLRRVADWLAALPRHQVRRGAFARLMAATPA